MTLLEGAGTLVLWCMAVVIGMAFAAVVTLWAWDKWQGWKWDRRAKR